MSGFYDNAPVISYNFGEIDFATTKTLAITGPAGKRGEIVEIHNSVTTTFVGTTTPGAVQVGLSGDLDAYGEVVMGTAAAPTAAGAAVRGEGSAGIPADTAVLVTCKAGTGGSVAGKGHVTVAIRWF